MLKELIHDKINEVFAEYQEAKHIISGDISVADQRELDALETHLEAIIDRVCEKQRNAMLEELTPSWYIYTDSEGIAHIETFGKIDMDMFFHNVSKRIAFDDLADETVQKIYYRGKEVEYAGWQPGMKCEFTDLDGNSVWVGYFPEWDH